MSDQNVLDNLSDKEKKIYEWLKSQANVKKNNEFEFSMRNVAEEVGVSIATVHRAFQKLTRFNAIKIITTAGKNTKNKVVLLGLPDQFYTSHPFLRDIEKFDHFAAKISTQMREMLQTKDGEITKLKETVQLLSKTDKDKELAHLKKELDEKEEIIKNLREVLKSYEGKIPGVESRIISTVKVRDDVIAFGFKINKDK